MKLLNSSITFFLSLFLSFAGLGQSEFNLPLSINGLGEENATTLTADEGFGGANLGFSNAAIINIGNPASYTQLYSQLADVGFYQTIRRYNFNSGNFSTAGGNFKNFFYGFPLGKRVGMVAGLRPLSTINYQFSEVATNEDIVTENLYEGNGGFNNVMIGFGVKIWKDSLNILSLGFNGNYLFGFRNRLLYTLISEPGSSNYNSRVQDRFNIRDFYGELGVMYIRRLNTKVDLSIGINYQPNVNMNSTGFSYAGTFSGTPNGELIKDTVLFSTDTGTVALGNVFGAGFTLDFNRKLTASFSFKSREAISSSVQGGSFDRGARTSLSLGFQYVPDFEEVTKIFKVARYRIGARVSETGLTYDNESVSEIGITFGLGIPLVKSQSLTSFNISYMAGFRNNGAINTYNEQFNTISVGVSIAPHKFDKWFLRRKID